jgi:hypothetical protein
MASIFILWGCKNNYFLNKATCPTTRYTTSETAHQRSLEMYSRLRQPVGEVPHQQGSFFLPRRVLLPVPHT